MNKQLAIFPSVSIYLWLLMICLGANVFETFIIYPNIFHDVPNSLETAKKFMVVLGPSDFFRPLGFVTLLTGIGALILSWRIKLSRKWIIGSISVIFIGEFLFSMTYFWPRNTIMFVEGMSAHPFTFLEKAAQEFQIGQWLRLTMNAAAAMLSFVSLLKIYGNGKTKS